MSFITAYRRYYLKNLISRFGLNTAANIFVIAYIDYGVQCSGLVISRIYFHYWMLGITLNAFGSFPDLYLERIYPISLYTNKIFGSFSKFFCLSSSCFLKIAPSIYLYIIISLVFSTFVSSSKLISRPSSIF